MSEEMEEEYPRLRRVTLKDRKKASKLLKAFADKSGNSKLAEMIPGVAKTHGTEADEVDQEAEAERTYKMIKNVLEGLIEWLDEDVTEWFRELVGVKTSEEYEDLPFDIEMYIVQELLKQRSFTGFFTRASGIYKKTRG